MDRSSKAKKKMAKTSKQNLPNCQKRSVKRKVTQKSKVSKIELLAPQSKRTISLVTDNFGDTLTVLSPDKKMEFHLEWGANGPVVKIGVAQIELLVQDSIDLKCSNFKVHASEGIEIQSEGALKIQTGEIRARTAKSIHLEGEKIRLNSPEEEDAPVPEMPLNCCNKLENNL